MKAFIFILLILVVGCSPSLKVDGDFTDNEIDITMDGKGMATYETPDGRKLTLTTQEKKEPSLIRTIFEAVLYKKMTDEGDKSI